MNLVRTEVPTLDDIRVGGRSSRNEVAHKLGIQGLPTTMIIGRDGRAVGALVGGAAWDSPEAIALIRFYIDAAGKPTPPPAPEAPDADVIKASGP